jgi:hypothetical protein
MFRLPQARMLLAENTSTYVYRHAYAGQDLGLGMGCVMSVLVWCLRNSLQPSCAVCAARVVQCNGPVFRLPLQQIRACTRYGIA